jgi:hypothetical protein
MNPFYQALDEGYSAEDVLGYISKTIPKMLPSIKKARNAGYTVQQILGFLSKKFESNYRPGMSESEIHAANRRSDAEMTKHGLKILGTVAAAPLAGAAARSVLSRALPASLAPSTGQITSGTDIADQIANQPQPSLPLGRSMISTEQQPPNQLQSSSSQPPSETQNIPQVSEVKQPEVKTINADELLTKHKFKQKVDDILKAGNDAEQTAAFFKKFYPQLAKDVEKEAGIPLDQVIDQYTSQKPTIKKNLLVATPKGVGEVKETREGESLVDIDGKMHKVSDEEIETEPEDIADLYDRLFEAIPDQYKSRMMNYAGYDEEANELLFRPHGGAAYVYKNIPQEFAEELKNRLHRAKTTGKNMYGMWHEGDQSYGAGMSALIKQLQAQYGGKGKEYVRKYNTLFDILGIPHEEKKRREEEKRKRKRSG